MDGQPPREAAPLPRTAISPRLRTGGDRRIVRGGGPPAPGRRTRRATDYPGRAARFAAERPHRPAEQFAAAGLALGARRRGDPGTAEQYPHLRLEWNRRLGVDSGTALVLARLGCVAGQRGDAERALFLHLEGLTAARRTGDPRAAALAPEGPAGARAAAGEAARAAELLGTAPALRDSVDASLPPSERADVDRARAKAARGRGRSGKRWPGAGAAAGSARLTLRGYPARPALEDTPAGGLGTWGAPPVRDGAGTGTGGGGGQGRSPRRTDPRPTSRTSPPTRQPPRTPARPPRPPRRPGPPPPPRPPRAERPPGTAGTPC